MESGAGLQTAHEEGPDPAVAVDKRGNLYFVWIGRDRLPLANRLARRR